MKMLPEKPQLLDERRVYQNYLEMTTLYVRYVLYLQSQKKSKLEIANIMQIEKRFKKYINSI